MTGSQRTQWGLYSFLFALFFLIAPANALNSTSGRFVVSGDDTSRNFETARWAEDTAGQFEGLLELTVPMVPNELIEIVLERSTVIEPAMKIAIFRSNGSLKRILTINLSRPLDQAVLQQGLVLLMLAGLIEDRRREAHLSLIDPSIPAWFSVGVAGALERGRVARCRIIVFETFSSDEIYNLQEVFRWAVLPEGWHSRQALCVLVTDWVISNPRSRNLMLESLISQQPVSQEAMAVIMGVSSLSRMEEDWRLWLQQQERLIQEFGRVTSEMIVRLRAEVWLQVPLSRQAGSISSGLSPWEVITARKQNPDISLLAAHKMDAIQRLTLGTAPEFVEAGLNYVLFYEGVARGTWGWRLKWQLSRADDALKKLAKEILDRKVYLDAFEEGIGKVQSGTTGSAGANLMPGLEKSAVESYLDWAEERFDKRN